MSNSDTNKGYAQEIFLRFKAGDPRAFRYYFTKYHESVLASSMRLLDDQQAAEDVVSEVFYTLYDRRNKIADERHLLSYIFTVSRSECADYLRRKKRREEAESGFDWTEQYSYIDLREIEEEQLSLYKKLISAIEKLPPLKKAVVILYFYEKKKTQFIASDMKVARQTVLNQLTKAKGLVRKSLVQGSTGLANFQ